MTQFSRPFVETVNLQMTCPVQFIPIKYAAKRFKNIARENECHCLQVNRTDLIISWNDSVVSIL